MYYLCLCIGFSCVYLFIFIFSYDKLKFVSVHGGNFVRKKKGPKKKVVI